MIDIGNRREIFVDDFLIDTLDGASLKLRRPRPAGTAIELDKPWEGRNSGYFTVIKHDDGYRMYYRGWPDSTNRKDDAYACCADSPDGKNWEKPELGLFEVEGSKKNNIILAGDSDHCHNFSPFLDKKPGVSEKGRFKALGGKNTSGLVGFTSADGIRWKKIKDEPLIPSVRDEYRYDSQNLAFWSELEGCYLCYFRIWREKIRTIGRMKSEDFITWSDFTPMSFGDSPMEELYVNQTHPYFRAPHIYIALPARFMKGRSILEESEMVRFGLEKKEDGSYSQGDDCSETVLVTSRGGDRYDRTFMEGFVRPGRDRQNWSARSNYAALGVVPTGDDEMSLYVQRHFAQPSTYIERLSLRTDGFSSVTAPFSGGQMVTKPFLFKGSKLVVGYATGASGHVRVELQDEAGKPQPDRGINDSVHMIGDEIEQEVKWKTGTEVSSSAAGPVRLRFEMKDADLYSLRFQ